MGVVKKVLGTVGKVFGMDNGDAIRDAANAQASAAIEAANKQVQATKDAAAASVAQVNSQAQATAQAQTAAINQSNLNAQLQEQSQNQQQQPQTSIDLSGGGAESTDPRRKYQSGQSAVGGTNGGVGIRLS
jgi:3-oxoacyl-ACP reductase-like protein